MQIKTIAQPKESVAASTTTTSGSVVVLGNNNTTVKDINGQIISPDKVTTNELNSDLIYSNNITNAGKITTDNITANTFDVTTIRVDSMNSSELVIDDLNVSDSATFQSGINVLGTGEFEDISSDNITNSDTITTHNLEVTGAAHFFELEIDKIKSAGGSLILTPADGFKIDSISSDTNYYWFYYRITEEPAGDPDLTSKINMWHIGDGALCQTFNLSENSGASASNKYYWARVVEVSVEPTNITLNGESYPCHWIKIDKNDYVGDLSPTVGDEIVMLGNSIDTSRQSAIYEAAYNSLDPGLQAPLIAFYQGINDFNLTSHRKSYFDKTSARFVGDFTIASTGQSITDYIDSQISIQSSQIHAELANTTGTPIRTVILTGDINYATNDYTPIEDTRIYLYDDQGAVISANSWAETSSNTYITINGIRWNLTYTQGYETQGDYTLIWSYNSVGYLDVHLASSTGKFNWGSATSVINVNIEYNDVDYLVTIPVAIVPNTSENVDIYRLFPYKDAATVNWSTNTLNVDLRFGIYHSYDGNTEILQYPDIIYAQFTIYALNGSVITTLIYGEDEWVSDIDNNEYYYRCYTTRSLDDVEASNKPVYIKVEIFDGEETLLDQHITNVIPDTTTLFTVTEGLTSSIQSNTSSITTVNAALSAFITTTNSNISQLQQTADSISTVVAQHTSSINTITGDITSLQTQYSTIEQRADSIELSVTNIEDGLSTTGIDIEQGKITITSENTDIIGNLNIYNSDTGLVIYDDNNRPKVQIQKSEISKSDTKDTDLDSSFYMDASQGTGPVIGTNTKTYTFTKSFSLGVYEAGEKISLKQVAYNLGFSATPIINDLNKYGTDDEEIQSGYEALSNDDVYYNIYYKLYKSSLYLEDIRNATNKRTYCRYVETVNTSAGVNASSEFLIEITVEITIPSQMFVVLSSARGHSGVVGYHQDGYTFTGHTREGYFETELRWINVVGTVLFDQSNSQLTTIGTNGIYSEQGGGNLFYLDEDKTILQRSYIDSTSLQKRYYGLYYDEDSVRPESIVQYTPATESTTEQYVTQPLASSKYIKYVEMLRKDQDVFEDDTYYLNTNESDWRYSPYLQNANIKGIKINSTYTGFDSEMLAFGYIYNICPQDEVIIINNACINDNYITGSNLNVRNIIISLDTLENNNKANIGYGTDLPMRGRELTIINNSNVTVYIINETSKGRASDRGGTWLSKKDRTFTTYYGSRTVTHYAGIGTYHSSTPQFMYNLGTERSVKLTCAYNGFWEILSE